MTKKESQKSKKQTEKMVHSDCINSDHWSDIIDAVAHCKL